MTNEAASIKTIMLSGTDYVYDLLFSLYRTIEEKGLSPWWFHERFPQVEHCNAMSNCLEAASRCDLLIVVIDARSGNKYNATGKTITEAEYDTARRAGKIVKVFVRNNVWYQCKNYQKRLKKEGPSIELNLSAPEYTADLGVYQFVNRIMHEVDEHGNPNIPWVRPFENLDDIVDVLEATLLQSAVVDYASNEQKDDMESMVLTESTIEEQVIKEDAILTVLQNASQLLQNDNGTFDRATLIHRAWLNLRHAPEEARRVLNASDGYTAALKSAVSVICKMAMKSQLDHNDLESLTNFASQGNQHLHYLTLILLTKTILYDYQSLCETQSFYLTLERLCQVKDCGVAKSVYDLLLRHKMGYLNLNADCLRIIDSSVAFFEENCKESTFLKIVGLIFERTGSALPIQARDLVDRLMSIATLCEDEIDAKWCTITLMRSLPLLDIDEEEDGSRICAKLISRMPGKIVSASSAIAVLYTSALLKSATRSLKSADIIRAQKEFVQISPRLKPAERIILQIQWAGTMIHLLNFGDDDSDPLVLQLIVIMKQGNLTKHPMLSNPIYRASFPIKTNLDSNSRINQIEALRKALGDFLKTMFRFSVVPVLRHNHCRVIYYITAARLSYVYKITGDAIYESLNSMIASQQFKSPTYCLRSLSAVEFVDRRVRSKLVVPLLTECINADFVEVDRFKLQIFRCLYWVYYYDDPPYRDSLIKIASTFAAKFPLDLGALSFSWIFYGCIRLRSESVEQEFVNALVRVVFDRVSDIETDLLEDLSENGIAYFESYVGVIREYSSRGSILAMVVSGRLNDPEVWNILGTSSFNLKFSDQDVEALKRATMFYLFATACGKSLPKRNAKYWFNYIRARSLLLKSLNRSVSSKFVIEVMSFLNRPEAQSFIHKDANVTCFVELVKLQSNRLTSEAWQQIAECRARYFWFNRLFIT